MGMALAAGLYASVKASESTKETVPEKPRTPFEKLAKEVQQSPVGLHLGGVLLGASGIAANYLLRGSEDSEGSEESDFEPMGTKRRRNDEIPLTTIALMILICVLIVGTLMYSVCIDEDEMDFEERDSEF